MGWCCQVWHYYGDEVSEIDGDLQLWRDVLIIRDGEPRISMEEKSVLHASIGNILVGFTTLG